MKQFFITGGTGYMGTRLISRFIKHGHHVIALVRKGSESKLPLGVEIIMGNPFDAKTFQSFIPAGCVFIQLLGVAHPSPKKAEQFKEIDLRSVKASADAAAYAGVSQFVYASVANSPSKLMHAYQEVRREGEEYCIHKKMNCTFICPWYVVGPGHWWPLLLLPFYGLAEIVTSWKMKARKYALVSIRQMLNALQYAAESESEPLQILEIKNIRNIDAKKNINTKTLLQKPSYL